MHDVFPFLGQSGPAPHKHPAMLVLIAALIVVEFAWHKLRGSDGYDLKESASSLFVAVGRLGTRAISALVQAPAFLWAYDHRLFTIPADNVAAIGALFLVSEFVYYWFHRFSHEVRWLWASHCVHHSPTRLNLSAAYRLGWTEALSGDWLFFLLPIFLGFAPLAAVGMMAANLSFQFFLHTEAVRSLGPLEWVLNTPAHHRVHHARNPECLDRNYGGVLIVFDRLFGTFAKAPADEPLRYGLVAKEPTYNPLKILFREWLDMARDVFHARSPAAAWRAVSGRP
jgi:sterol desaturase/sphingolipid hydroxylase (fatty acid hydroxylase superfamily)